MDDSSPRPGNRIRVGNDERSRALDLLSTAFTDGYLDIHEFDQRTSTAASAIYRDELDALFLDLPRSASTDPAFGSVAATDSETVQARSTGVAETQRTDMEPASSADVDLDDVMTRGKKVARADAIIWSVAMGLFFLGLFVFGWSYFWVTPIVGGFASVLARGIIGLSDEEEDVYDELEEAERKKRAERLEIAKKRRLELESE